MLCSEEEEEEEGGGSLTFVKRYYFGEGEQDIASNLVLFCRRGELRKHPLLRLPRPIGPGKIFHELSLSLHAGSPDTQTLTLMG